jgi:hypothetical protein
MRLPLLPLRAVVLAGPVALAFFQGGYFDGARLVALIVAGGALAYAAGAAPAILPQAPAGRAALAGLAGLTAWTAASAGWAPRGETAGADLERLLLYTAALIAAAAAFGPRRGRRAAEPLVAAGALVVVGYGLAGRLLPGLIDVSPGQAAGRLDQPLTYWNAMGALAAMGAVLAVRLAGDVARPVAVRAAGAAGCVPLLLGVYLSFSRGAVAALAAGLVVLLLLAPTRSALRAALVCLELGGLTVAAAGLSPAVRALQGGDAALQGALVAVVLAAAMATAVALTAWAARDEATGSLRSGPLRLPRAAPAVGAVVVASLVIGPLLVARSGDAPAGSINGAAGNARFASVGSNRYEYWKVALNDFAAHPVRGAGSGSFEVTWLRERPIPERVRDAHSLPLETLAELGLVGLALLLVMVGGVAAAARTAHRADPSLAAGPAAALVVWGLHACLDWDWEMPALTLVAVTLAGLLAAAATGPGDPASPAAARSPRAAR